MRRLQDWEGGRVWGPFLIPKKNPNTLHACNHKLPTLHLERFWKRIIFPALCQGSLRFSWWLCYHTPGNRFISVLSGSNWHLGPPGAFSSRSSIYPIGDRRPRSGEESRPQTWAPARPRHKLGLRRARGPPRRCTRVSRRHRGASTAARESVAPGASRSPASPSWWVRGGRSPARHASGPPPSPRLPVIRSRLRRVPGRKQRRGAGSARRRRRRQRSALHSEPATSAAATGARAAGAGMGSGGSGGPACG